MRVFVDFWNALVDVFACRLGWQGVLLVFALGIVLTLCTLSTPH